MFPGCVSLRRSADRRPHRPTHNPRTCPCVTMFPACCGCSLLFSLPPLSHTMSNIVNVSGLDAHVSRYSRTFQALLLSSTLPYHVQHRECFRSPCVERADAYGFRCLRKVLALLPSSSLGFHVQHRDCFRSYHNQRTDANVFRCLQKSLVLFLPARSHTVPSTVYRSRCPVQYRAPSRFPAACGWSLFFTNLAPKNVTVRSKDDVFH
jgi:hypothetical protein